MKKYVMACGFAVLLVGCATTGLDPRIQTQLDSIILKRFSLRAGSVYDGATVLNDALQEHGSAASDLKIEVVPSRNMRIDGWICFEVNDTISVRKALDVLCALADCTWSARGSTITIELKPGVVQEAADPRWQGKDPSNHTSDGIRQPADGSPKPSM